MKIPKWVRDQVECEWCYKLMLIEGIEVIDNVTAALITYVCLNDKCDHQKNMKEPAKVIRKLENGYGINRIKELIGAMD